VITHQDFEKLGFRFGAAPHRLSVVASENRGVYEATIIHIPGKDGAFKLFGPIRAGYHTQSGGSISSNESLCAVFPTADELYAYLIEQTLRRGRTFTQLAKGEEI
jgi:hypothetical protein